MKFTAVFLLVAVGVASAAFIPRPIAHQANIQVANKDFGDFIQQIVQSVYAQASSVIAQILEHAPVIQGHVVGLTQQAMQQAQAMMANLQAVASVASGSLLTNIQALIQQIKDVILPAGTRMVATKGFQEFIQTAINSAVSYAQSAYAELSAYLGNLSGQLTAQAQIAIGHAQQALSGLQQIAVFCSGALRETVDRLIENLTALLNGVGKVAVVQNKDIGDFFQALVNSVVAQAKEFIQQIKDQLALVGGQLSHLSSQAVAQAQQTIDSLQSIAAFCHGEVLNQVNAMIDSLTEMVGGSGRAVAVNKGLGEFFQAFINLAVNAATASYNAIMVQWHAASEQFGAMGEAAGNQIQETINNLQAVVGMAHGQAQTTIQNMIDQLTSIMNGKTSSAAANKGLGDLFSSGVIQQVIQSVIAQAQQVIAQFAHHAQALTTQAVAQVQVILAELQTIQSFAPQSFYNVIQGLIQQVQSILSGNKLVHVNASKGFGELINSIINSAISQATIIYNQILQQLQVAGGQLTTLSSNIVQKAREAIAALQQIAIFCHGSVLESVNTMIDNLTNMISGYARSAVIGNKDIFDLLTALVNSITTAAQATYNSIIGQFQAAAGHVGVLSQSVILQAQETLGQLQSIASTAGGLFSGVVGGLIDQYTEMLKPYTKASFIARE